MIILRKNFNSASIQITPQPQEDKEQVCCDLTVGDVYMEPGAAAPYKLEKPYRLQAGESIVVRTREEFTVPDGIMGLLCSKGSVTARGLIVPNTKVDPLFVGHLDITGYNASRSPVTIQPKMRFCSIVFHELQDKTCSTQGRRAPDLAGKRRGFYRRTWDRHAGQIIAGAITFLVTVVGSAIVTYVTVKLTGAGQ